MRPHWSTHLTSMAERLARAPRLLIASDFDGTLSPIVDHPSKAAILPEAVEILNHLANSHPRVRLAFLSGRSLLDLAERLPQTLSSAVLAGNHGLELRGAGLDWTHPSCFNLRPVLQAVELRLRQLCERFEGAEVEDKGLSLTLHYRRVAAEAVDELKELAARLPLPDALRRHEGKMVIEFGPRVEWHKGRALRRIMQRLGIPSSTTIYLGDDHTDEDGFRELHPNGLSLHVGLVDARSEAVMHAHEPTDVVHFLTALARSL